MNSLEGIYLTSGLGTPWDPPGRVAASVTLCYLRQQMDGFFFETVCFSANEKNVFWVIGVLLK